MNSRHVRVVVAIVAALGVVLAVSGCGLQFDTLEGLSRFDGAATQVALEFDPVDHPGNVLSSMHASLQQDLEDSVPGPQAKRRQRRQAAFVIRSAIQSDGWLSLWHTRRDGRS